MSVGNSLASLWPCFCHTNSTNDVVQSLFTHQQQVLTRVALGPGRFFKIASQLSLTKPIVVFDLLLLHQRHAVIGWATSASVHSGWLISTLIKCTRCSTVFINQRLEPTIDSAFGASISSHKTNSCRLHCVLPARQTDAGNAALVPRDFGKKFVRKPESSNWTVADSSVEIGPRFSPIFLHSTRGKIPVDGGQPNVMGHSSPTPENQELTSQPSNDGKTLFHQETPLVVERPPKTLVASRASVSASVKTVQIESLDDLNNLRILSSIIGRSWMSRMKIPFT